MNYLFIEIFIYLLVAGIIGLAIGWLLKGDFKKKLLLNNHTWNKKIEQMHEKCKHDMQALMNKHDQYIQENDSEQLKLKQQIQESKSLLSTEKNEYALLQMEYKKLKLDSNLELRRIDIEWEDKLNDVISKNDNSIQILNREIALLKKELNHEKNKIIHLD